MDTRATILARRYAQAFLNAYSESITPALITNISSLANYVQQHKNALIFFSLHHIPLTAKLEALDSLEAHIKPSEPVKRLFEQLIRDDRSSLLPEVFAAICTLYRAQHNIMLFDVQHSHVLPHDAITYMVKFLKKATGKNIEYSTHLNPALIAGIRLQSETRLWEHSIRQQLNRLSKTIATKDY